MRVTKISLDESDFRQIQGYAETNPSHNFKLCVVQQPTNGKAISSNLRGMRWPIEPPPVLELTSPEKEPQKWLYIHNPNWFCVADIIPIEIHKKATSKKEKESKEGSKDNLSGLLASSLHKVKNPEDRNEHGYFVFGDLNVRDAGRYKLEFTLFEMRRYDSQVYAAKVDSIISDEFEVSPHKSTLPSKDSTKLSKTLSESGVKIRLRKESTKRKQTTFNWSATTNDNFSYGASRSHPTQMLAPIQNMQNFAPMGPPSIAPNTRLNRSNGEDISRRLSVVQNEMNIPVTSQPPLVGSMEAQHHNTVQGQHYNTSAGMQGGGYDYQLSPLSRHAGNIQQSPRDMSGFSAPSQFQPIQPPTQSQPWNFSGQGSFQPEASRESLPYFGGHQLPDPRMNHERIDSGYSSHGRSSLTHMESGAMDQYNARSSPYGPSGMPGIQLPPNESMNQHEWHVNPAMQTYGGYDPAGSGRQADMGMGLRDLPPGYVFSAAPGTPVYGHPQQQTSHP